MHSLQYKIALSICLVTALFTAVLAVQHASTAEWQWLIDAVSGENLITFRTRLGAGGSAKWTDADLVALEEISGVATVAWRGGFQRHTVAGAPYTTPHVDASPGYLSFLRVPFEAGRDLSRGDAGARRVVISERIARDLSLSDAIGTGFDRK